MPPGEKKIMKLRFLIVEKKRKLLSVEDVALPLWAEKTGKKEKKKEQKSSSSSWGLFLNIVAREGLKKEKDYASFGNSEKRKKTVTSRFTERDENGVESKQEAMYKWA